MRRWKPRKGRESCNSHQQGFRRGRDNFAEVGKELPLKILSQKAISLVQQRLSVYG